MEVDELKESSANLLNLIDRKIKILILITILFAIYLISSTQLTHNSQDICSNYINGTCNGNVTNGKCCVKGLIYTEKDDVPKNSIGWYQGIALIGLFLMIIYMMIKNIAHPDFLNYKSAKRILENHFKDLYPNYKIRVGPVAKCRSHYETQKPIKWVVGIIATYNDEEEYFQGEVDAHWRSSKLEDHIRAIKKRDEPLTASVIDKEETADIIFITSFDLMKNKKVMTQIGKKNVPP